MEKAKTGHGESAYALANGDVVEVPDGFVVLNPEHAIEAVAACVVAVRNAPEDTPRFVTFLDNPVRSLCRTPDLDRIDAAIVQVWPPFQEILDAKVEPEFDEQGKCTNAAEHLCSPYPGYFPLWPKSTEAASAKGRHGA